MSFKQLRFGMYSILSLVVVAIGFLFIWLNMLWLLLLVLLSLLLLALLDLRDTTPPAIRFAPLLGRPMVAALNASLHERPFDRRAVDWITRSSQGVSPITSFGSSTDMYHDGFEFLAHSLFSSLEPTTCDRVVIGEHQCAIPYSACRINASALGFGPVSAELIQALNCAASRNGFFQNTGEDGVSEYHFTYEGDLVWQLGPGYSGCRTSQGKLDFDRFSKIASRSTIRMIEVKLSQGGKPGLGGLIPGIKVTKEIATFNEIPTGQDVITPPRHFEFANFEELLWFIAKLRRLAGGKPVGVKLCVGNPLELEALFSAASQFATWPDFLTVDGGEGGSGASRSEFQDSVGMPLLDGLAVTSVLLDRFALRKKIVVLASGKVATPFDVLKAVALGANVCNIGRGLMISAGCVQVGRCHIGDCPAGIATQDPSLRRSMKIGAAAGRMVAYHAALLSGFSLLLASGGFPNVDAVSASRLFRRCGDGTLRSFDEIYLRNLDPRYGLGKVGS
jgi:glutamate synthase domain-containing protein 2